MKPDKYDSFRPKRATNIDGFFAKPIQNRPRQPKLRSSSASPRHKPANLADMPRRANPQAILGSGTSAPVASQSMAYPLDGHGESRRQRRYAAPEQESQGKQGKQPKKHSWKRGFKRAGLVFGCLVVLGGIWFGFKFYRDIANLTGNNNPLSLFGAFHPSPLKNQDGRVNILVAANSADDPGHNGANLTDSIMVLSVDTRKNTALILSIPRDLWVEIPGYGHAKINEAYPDGGMNTLTKVVHDNLGLTVDYHALVNYGAFRDLVNAVGKITITINSDDPRGIYDPDLDYTTRTCCALADYPNGKVTLDGKQALNLARARGDAYGSYGYDQSDFTRTMYQREMLMAIKDKASQTSVVANPLKVTKLVDAVGNNVSTDLRLGEIETLYSDMKKIDDNKIGSFNINTLAGSSTTMLENYTSPAGESALIPSAGLDNFSDIKRQINKLLSANPLVREGAVVVVLNATDTPGLASGQENKLFAKGMDVSVGNAPVNQATSMLIDNSGGDKPNTLAYLKKQYKATVTTNAELTADYPGADFILLLGQNTVPKKTGT